MQAANYFQEQARECRSLAQGLGPSRDKDGLLMLASHYEREAKRAVADNIGGGTEKGSGPRPVQGRA